MVKGLTKLCPRIKKMEFNVKKALLTVLTVFSVLAMSPQIKGDIDTVELDITDYGTIQLLLYPDITPITVTNFLDYVNDDFYDGLIFHRVFDNFVNQTGNEDPNGDSPPKNDPIANEFLRSNIRGTIAMAKVAGDPNSATSQWFINVNDNSQNLDNQNGGFTVFGRVVNGMDIADEINNVPVDGNKKPQTPIIIASATQKVLFDPNSNDFADTPYLGALVLNTPYIYIGQGDHLYQTFNVELTNETLADISTLKITQSGAAASGVDQYQLWLAKDIFTNIWIVKYILNGTTEIDAASAESVVPFTTLADEQMNFRLINGDTVPFDLSDPNDTSDPANTILTTVDGITTKQEIVSFEETDALFPDHLDSSFTQTNLVVVKTSIIGDAGGEHLWQYYHPLIGLAFEISGTGGEISDVDHSGTGWHLPTYSDGPTTAVVSFKASENREKPSDKFTISGSTNLKLADLVGNEFSIMLDRYQSPWIPFSLFKSKKDGKRFVYEGSPDGKKNKFDIVIDPAQPDSDDPNIFTEGSFSITGKKLNLNNIDTPLTATIFSGTFGESTPTKFKGDDSMPIRFRLGYTDRIKVKSFKHTTIPSSTSGYSNIKVKGKISVDQEASTIDLTDIDVVIKWSQKTVIFDKFKRSGKGNDFVHKSSGNIAHKASFDIDKGSFSVEIKNTLLANPSTPRSFSVSFQSGTKIFDETVTLVGIGTLPAESNE